jgi:hypothetical protein
MVNIRIKFHGTVGAILVIALILVIARLSVIALSSARTNRRQAEFKRSESSAPP